MANSEQLRKKRGALRAGVTRALTQLTDLLQQTDPDLSEVSVQVDYLKDRESALSTLDDAILALTDEENLDREVETAQDYSEKISCAIGLTGCPGGAAKTVLKRAPYDKCFGFE
ncbi:hypothetical protein HPB52_005664 [Rhipicephalus sanguineus]|uniref:Uncharacterized protein n=1 Tax=Rhipicephalus sanguineus TaxID=34632 RepID=A0A9D4SSH7_RHISA|nr:hypothetical protein HPB52_005664 [Rhipicephalus sanguineus]